MDGISIAVFVVARRGPGVRSFACAFFWTYFSTHGPTEGSPRRIVRKGLTAEDRVGSSLAPGTTRRAVRVVYRFENELPLEMHNRTVHGALLMALAET